jgi:SagB-type dehydrogenase family enzyme
MEQIALPAPKEIDMTLASAIRSRRSAFGGNPERVFSLEDCGTLLGLALGRHEQSNRRHYPSGGGLFPIETYLLSERLEGQEPGVFHYNPTKHVLERLWDIPSGISVKRFAPNPDTIPLSSLIIFTAVWQRTTAKYGDLGFLHSLLEAGHMSENILLVATALGLAARPMAGFEDALVSETLDLIPGEETPLHSVTLCAPDRMLAPTEDTIEE